MSDVMATSRQLLRQWLSGTEDETTAAIDALGRNAIRASARAAERLAHGMATAHAANDVLQHLQVLAERFAQPPRRRFPVLLVAAPAAGATASDLDDLVASLARERDAVARGLIGIESERARLQEAEGALDEALALIRACSAAAESASREIAGEHPERALFLRETATAQLMSREQDVITQLAVTRQGVLALQLVSESQEAVAKAIDRARESTVSALHTAMAARHAMDGNRDLLQQAQALEHTAAAARQQSPEDGRDVERALADAVEQVRRALNAAQPGAHAPRA